MAAAALPKSNYLILGLLSLCEMSGYDLKQAADMSVAHFYASPARSQVYTELRRLSELEYVDEREVEQSARPDKRVYEITPRGEQALRDWLENTPTSADVVKSHLLLKVFFGNQMDKATLIQEVRRYRDASVEFREMLQNLRGECDGGPGTLFIYLTVSQVIAHSQVNETWADEALRLLESADEEFTWSSDRAPGVAAHVK